MKIAIDLSPLQNAHRMRGIGFTLISLINNLPPQTKKEHELIFYVLPEDEALFKDPFEMLDITEINYELRTLSNARSIRLRTPAHKLNIPVRAINKLMRIHAAYFGGSRITDLSGIDVFLQADQNHPLPNSRDFRKILIIYDLIPQVLEWDYLRNYKTARLRGATRHKAFSESMRRRLLTRRIRINTKRADQLVAISEHTKDDFVRLLNVPSAKITVVPLGVSPPESSNPKRSLVQYRDTSWGFVRAPLILDPKVPFLLFLGGVDSRRKLEDLVAAFNNLRAQGKELKLVLAGDIMLGPSAITTPQIRKALKQSSYLDDIVFMGFIDDNDRDWLYNNALAFVFPSRYEGFGLPVLEALIHGCPVISYRNDAVIEVAGDAPLYADNLQGLMSSILELLAYNDSQRAALRKRGISIADRYGWQHTSSNIMKIMTQE